MNAAGSSVRLGAIVGLALFAPAGAGTASSPDWSKASMQPNILLIVADDMGVDMLALYGEGSDLPITPVIDGLAASGTFFRNAWSNPNCSPTRSTLLTGRYGFRTGVGNVIFGRGEALPLSETILPEVLDLGSSGYEQAAIGKWHLGNNSVGGLGSPNLAGFSHFDGGLRGGLEPAPVNYFFWPNVVDGQVSTSTTYNTTAIVDSASAWIQQASEPWFCYLPFYAPHAPAHRPPAGLYYEDLEGLEPGARNRAFYKAMIEAMDTEMGRLFDEIGTDMDNTHVIFLGDNGTPAAMTLPPFFQDRAKGTVYEGGVNVPLIVSGPANGQPGSESFALVNTTDIFATVAELAGVDLGLVLPDATLDSISMLPYLADPNLPSLRSFLYAEVFNPVGAIGRQATSFTRAISDGRYKLIVSGSKPGAGTGETELDRGGAQFYDLQQDAFEQNNLLDGSLTPSEAAARQALQFRLEQLLNTP
jgi:arylsulfatase B